MPLGCGGDETDGGARVMLRVRAETGTSWAQGSAAGRAGERQRSQRAATDGVWGERARAAAAKKKNA